MQSSSPAACLARVPSPHGLTASPLLRLCHPACQDVARADASVELVPSDTILSPSAVFRSVDCVGGSDADLDFSAPFELSVSTDGTLRCFVVHFDTIFDLTAQGGVRTAFSTSASTPPTHWKQTALYLKVGLPVRTGDVLSGLISCSRQAEYKRGYDISVTYKLNGADGATQLFRLA